MSQGPTINSSLTISESDVSVTKTVSADEFPVPAVSFALTNDGEEAVTVRLTDKVPEEFSMDSIGFHPDFESDRWAAYKDNRVEFERTLEPGEEVRTVYGVRIDDPEELTKFVTDPSLEEVSADESDDLEDVIGPNNSQLVRDVLSGKRETLPGLDDEADEELEEPVDGVEESEPEPAEVASDLSLDDASGEPIPPTRDAEVSRDVDETVDADEEDDEPEPLTLADPTAAEEETTPASESTDEGTATEEETTPAEETPTDEETTPAVTRRAVADEDDTEDEVDASDLGLDDQSEEFDEPASAVPEGGIAAMLADEIRAGNVEDDDLVLLREELELATPRSIDVRIRRLQRQVGDLAAYADALREFIDEEGTAEEVLTDVQTDASEAVSTVESLESTVEDEREAREAIRGDLDALDEQVQTVDDKLAETELDIAAVGEEAAEARETSRAAAADAEAVDERVESVAEDAATANEGVERVEREVSELATDVSRFGEDVTALDDDLGAVTADVEDVDARLDEIERRLDEELKLLRADVKEVSSELEGVEEFRDRLNNVFNS